MILVKDFNLYTTSELEKEEDRFVHIIDNDGDYLVYGGGKDIWNEYDDNIFDALNRAGIDLSEIKEKIENKESMLLEMKTEEESYLLFFSPVDKKNWCAVTVLTEKAAMANMDYSRKIVLTFIFKLMCVILTLIVIGYYILTKEKKEIKSLNRELMLKDKIFQAAISETGSYVFSYDLKDKTMTFMNQSKDGKETFPEILYYFPENVGHLAPEGSAAYNEIKRMIRELESGQENVEGSFSLERAGRIVHYKSRVIRITEESEKEGFCVGTMVDVTAEKQNEFMLRDWIGKDPLTKTYNRMAASEKVEEILKRETGSTCAFLIMDLDNFKGVNDSLGHLIGDKVLVDVATIIQHHVRSKDIVCHLGGDEFVVFLVDIPESMIEKNVTALLKKLNLTYGDGNKKESISASVGIAIAPREGVDFQTLYEKADQALYEVKHSGKNGYRIYSENGITVKEED